MVQRKARLNGVRDDIMYYNDVNRSQT